MTLKVGEILYKGTGRGGGELEKIRKKKGEVGGKEKKGAEDRTLYNYKCR